VKHATRHTLATPSPDTVAPGEIKARAKPRACRQHARRAAEARDASGRRRSVDPATCGRDNAAAEMELMQAMQQYKLSSGRMFPTWSEVLEVLTELGYSKPANSTPGA
jgi:hypothetical protein